MSIPTEVFFFLFPVLERENHVIKIFVNFYLIHIFL